MPSDRALQRKQADSSGCVAPLLNDVRARPGWALLQALTALQRAGRA
ncbi:MAG: hypothetical protein ACK4R2_13660 [Roseateles sp.]